MSEVFYVENLQLIVQGDFIITQTKAGDESEFELSEIVDVVFSPAKMSTLGELRLATSWEEAVFPLSLLSKNDERVKRVQFLSKSHNHEAERFVNWFRKNKFVDLQDISPFDLYISKDESLVGLKNQVLTIHHWGATARRKGGYDQPRQIPITAIQEVRFRPAEPFSAGYISFVTGVRKEKAAPVIAGSTQTYLKQSDKDYAREDENSMTFSVEFSEEAKAFRDAVQKLIDTRPSTDQTKETSFASEADALEKFAKLRDAGVISDVELEAKKRQILGL